MLVNKKPKQNEDKGKVKAAEAHPKKPKKPKNGSPSKTKGTPEKKKARKDENSQCNKPSAASGQHSEYYKSKQSQRHSNFHKKSQNKEAKSKLLTTSPILFEHSKSKSKEKSRSISKLNTYRSTQDKEHFNKSITKKLFPQAKQNKSRSKEKSKSRSRLKTDRDVSPLKEIKQPKRFDVADREIKYNKHETSQLKKTMKKKIQNTRSKAEPFLYPADPAEESEEPRVKLKKKVPQIKTEFSERRGSYFDENLLRKLEVSRQEGKKAECPFLHIKSNFQERRKENLSFYSRSEARALEEAASSHTLKVEVFKREQERKWNMMLSELQNLKNEPQVAEKIDVLIEYLNQNYVSLQEKALELSAKEHKSVEGNHNAVHFDSIITSSLKSSVSEQDFLKHLALPKGSTTEKHSPQQLEKEIVMKQRGSNDALSVKSDKSSLKFLSPISFENQPKSEVLEPAISEKQVVQVSKQADQPESGEVAFKRSTNINLSDFYTLIQKQQGERKAQFEPFLKLTQEDIDNFSAQFIREETEHKISDRNILHDLNILDCSDDDHPTLSNKTEEFREEMERHRKKEAVAFDDYESNFHNEVRINEDMSSESLLLNISENHSRKERLVEEVEQALVLDFCVTILRSKTLLHNFITTYSQLVESNMINVNIGFSDPKTPTECSNEYVRSVVVRLLDHIEANYQQCFMRQVKLPFQCRPIDILKYIRSTEEEIIVSSLSEEGEEDQLQAPYFNEQRIEEFEREVLKNEFFIPGYFSFNHCIYDEFNDIFEELRPYGSRGKPIFSLELSHPVTDFAVARTEVLSRVDTHLASKYHQETISDEKYPNEEGVFEIVYFTSYDLIDLIFEQEAEKILRTIELAQLKNQFS